VLSDPEARADLAESAEAAQRGDFARTLRRASCGQARHLSHLVQDRREQARRDPLHPAPGRRLSHVSEGSRYPAHVGDAAKRGGATLTEVGWRGALPASVCILRCGFARTGPAADAETTCARRGRRIAGRPGRLRAAGDTHGQVDHIQDLAKGGPDHPRQMIALCPNCHAIKTRGRTREQLRHELFTVARQRHESILSR
jgi:hypothetical protein